MALSSEEIALESVFKSPALMDLSARNFVVKERYKVLRLLAETSRTNVFEAWDVKTRQKILLHVVKNSFFRRSEELQNWIKSLKSMRRLKDFQGSLPIEDLDLWKKKLVVATASFDGIPLMHLMESGARLPLEFVLKIGLKIGLNLKQAIELRVTSRNLSREDVFINREGEVRILRFSPSRILDLGPELCLDCTGDLYFLGTLLFEMLVGEAAFSQKRNHAELERAHLVGCLKARYREAPESVVEGVADLFFFCVTRDVDKRFSKIQQFVDKSTGVLDEVKRIRTEMEIRTDKEQLNSAFDVVHALRGEAKVEKEPEYSRVWSGADAARRGSLDLEGWFRLIAVAIIVLSFCYKFFGSAG